MKKVARRRRVSRLRIEVVLRFCWVDGRRFGRSVVSLS